MAQARRRSDTDFSITLLHHVKYGLRESGFLLLAGVALFLFTALMSFNVSDPAWTHTHSVSEIRNLGGVVGAWFADITFYFFGFLAYLLPLAVAYGGWRLFHLGGCAELDGEIVFFRCLGVVVALLSGCGLAALVLQPTVAITASGGVVGEATSAYLVAAFGLFGCGLFLLALFLAGINLATGLSWVGVLDATGAAVLGLFKLVELSLRFIRSASPAFVRRDETRLSEQPQSQHDAPKVRRRPKPAPPEPALDDAAPKAAKLKSKKTAKRRVEPVINAPEMPKAGMPAITDEWGVDPTPGDASLPLPSIGLLDVSDQENIGYSDTALAEMSRRVEDLLRDFGVDVQVVAVEPGPVIIRFELNPAPGVKVSRISNLAKDLARGLSVISVRVVEVIPGKSVIGLEIPNQQRQIVFLRDVFDSAAYRNAVSPLTLVLGTDIAGKPVVTNLSKMPHLLIAGTTGAGKSVAVNAMLLSMLYKATPKDARLILVDPKMLELSVYEDIPHLLAPVVTDMKDAATALRWCVGEMERRYRLMAALKVRNIAGFNKIVGEAIATGKPIADPLQQADAALSEPAAQIATLETLPFIVVVIDELADMMMVVGKKVEELIARLAQKARASGIHLILATQRPSVDVITGLIKANIPTRIAFQVSSKVDSRTILDQMGAESLLGHGDMLFLPPGTGFPQRVHGAFVADHEVHKVVDFIKRSGKPDYSQSILQEPAEGNPYLGDLGLTTESSSGESDPLYDQAVQIVLESRKASISYVQRRLKIGYNRAARMMEEMESAGVVGTLQSNGTREVLVPEGPEL